MKTTELSERVAGLIRKTFLPSEFEMVRDLVKEFHWELRPAVDERIHLDIVEVAAGNLDKVRELIGLAKLDWRDLIVVAEYDSVDGKLVLNDRGRLRLREMASQQSQSPPKTSELP